ncbi:MAG: plasma-membrane proton-efflux P-type ATPase [Thermoprotei archaeon]
MCAETDGSAKASFGLSSEEARKRLSIYGYNEVVEHKVSFTLVLAKKFWGITPWMLEITIALTWILHKYVDAYIVAGLLIFNAGLSLFEEKRANSAVAALKQRLHIQAKVKRDGEWVSIPAREVVPGDTIRLRAGDIAPADAKIVEGRVEVDQSALTGESLAVSKTIGEDVYSGSVIKRGETTCVVIATGAKTYFGRTVELVQLAKPKLHMEEVTASVVRWLLLMVVSLLALSLGVSYIRGINLTQILPLTVVLLVSAIPVALPSMFNISMAVGSLELSKKGVLITRLSASEDAATMDVLCADKTGTLTKNKLSVTEIAAFNGFNDMDVALFGALASNEADRDPIDLAFLASARHTNGQLGGYTVVEFTPFDPSTRMTQALVSIGGKRFRVCKGAVETVLTICKSQPNERVEVEKRVEAFTQKGYRVLAVAYGTESGEYTLSGVVALSDELRDDSLQLIDELEGLGVSVKMLTGDALPVAKEVARKLHLTGPVERMSALRGRGDEEEYARIIDNSSGIAEIYPEDKYNIVKALQKKGHTVGMTGDGVNDAAALKQAEVGIAVKDATDVAKGAASAVLTVEGLEPIVDMVKVGRMIYQRVVTWVINKIVKTFQIVVFVVLSYLFTGVFPVSVFSMVLYLFLTDFVTLSISTDRVRYSKRPDTWNIGWLVALGVLVGVLVVAESLFLFYVGLSLFDLRHNPDALHTYVFSYLVFSGLLNVLIVREREHFWRSTPSRMLLVSVVADVVLIAAISLLGFYNLKPITPLALLFSGAWAAAASFGLNDPLKALIIRRIHSPTKASTVIKPHMTGGGQNDTAKP